MKKISFLLTINTFLFSINQFNNQQISCDFNTDFCDYSHNEFVQRYNGKSPSINSGPSGDRIDEQNGFYVLCNGKLLRNEQDKCKLYKNISISTESSFQFWYYMFGTQIGTLELIKDDSDILWSLTGKQKNEWLLAELKIPPGDYKLEFSANRSSLGRISSDIGIDDIMIQGQELTTQFVTVTRTSVIPVLNISTNFDQLNNLNGWRSFFDNNKWIQTNGNTSNLIGLYGPGSDWSSLNNLKNYTTTLLINPRIDCSIPYELLVYPDKKEYYCRRVFAINRISFICGLYPISDSTNKQIGLCTLGYYMMITSDKFETPTAAFRSRFYSPVFKIASQNPFCISFKYNIYSDQNDGFKLIIENYLNTSENLKIFEKIGPLIEDRWYSESLQIDTIDYEQIIIYFEPIRGSDKNEYASISVDSITLKNGICDLEPTTTTIPTTPTTTITTSTTTTSTTTTTISTTSKTSSNTDSFTSSISAFSSSSNTNTYTESETSTNQSLEFTTDSTPDYVSHKSSSSISSISTSNTSSNPNIETETYSTNFFTESTSSLEPNITEYTSNVTYSSSSSRSTSNTSSITSLSTENSSSSTRSTTSTSKITNLTSSIITSKPSQTTTKTIINSTVSMNVSIQTTKNSTLENNLTNKKDNTTLYIGLFVPIAVVILIFIFLFVTYVVIVKKNLLVHTTKTQNNINNNNNNNNNENILEMNEVEVRI